MLDEVAWLFNLRGSDVDYNPGQQPRLLNILCSSCLTLFIVFLGYAVITSDKTVLFVDEAQVSDEIRSHLVDVEIRSYDTIFSYLQALSSELGLDKKKVGLSYRYVPLLM